MKWYGFGNNYTSYNNIGSGMTTYVVPDFYGMGWDCPINHLCKLDVIPKMPKTSIWFFTLNQVERANMLSFWNHQAVIVLLRTLMKNSVRDGFFWALNKKTYGYESKLGTPILDGYY